MAHYDFESNQYRSEEGASDITYLQPDGQAAFLSFALYLEIPIISNSRNVAIHGNSSFAGAGASAAVSNHEDVFEFDLDSDFVNPGTDWFAAPSRPTIELRYVTKKIRTHTPSTDAQHLKSMVNEIRILAASTIRQVRTIVPLLAISWQERPDQGRHWPQLLLQKADMGNIDTFARSVALNLQTKFMLALDVLHGLHALHAHDVTHCDVKPQNILVFEYPLRRSHPEFMGKCGLDRAICAKVCDFGFSVIHTDYDTTSSHRFGIGTYPYQAPEMESCRHTQLAELHSVDIYSFALTFASIVMNGREPFAGLLPENVTRIKAGDMPELTAAERITMEVEEHSDLKAIQGTYVSNILGGALASRREDRWDLLDINNSLSEVFGLTVAHHGFSVVEFGVSKV